MGDSALDIDVGEYCRRVEEHLARVNDGHLVRIVGPAFEMVRGWALQGIPLSIVCRGIELKAERHRAGRSKRPLRLEFCEADVREVFDGWRRAVGIGAAVTAVASEQSESPAARKPPSAVRHLDRAIERLGRAAGQLQRSDTYRDAIGLALDAVSAVREAIKSARGADREPLLARLPEIDAMLVQAARREVGAEGLERLAADALVELAPYRARLSSETWDRSVSLSVDRLLRDELGLPTLAL